MEENRLQIEIDEFLPLRDVVFNTLRKAILTGQLKPGERLMETHVADQLGVSRTPVREAVRKLELEGLVTVVPRRGTEVSSITEKSMQDVLEVRRALDILSVELACERITEEDLVRLQEACARFEQVIETGNVADMAKEDVALHEIIVEATGNIRLKQLTNNLAEQMYRYRFAYLQDDISHDMLVVEHEAIYRSILERDKEKAAKAAKIHIDNQELSIIKHIRME